MFEDPSPSFSFSRKWSQRINVLVGISALLAIVAMLNYLASRHYVRFHLRSNDRAQLSPLTKRLIGALTNNVKVICFFAREDTLFSDVRELLLEYKTAGPRITVEMVDPLRDPGAAALVQAKYGIQRNEKAFVLFDCQGRTKLILQADLFDYDVQPLISGQSKEVNLKDFKGELLFTSAIYYITSQRAAKAYFLMGTGGPSPEDAERESGYSKLARLLRASGVEWATLDLSRPQPIPSDCSLLLIVSPQQRLADSALEAIQRYFENGGRAMILFDTFGLQRETGLETLLSKFGVKVGFDHVTDADKGQGQSIFIQDFGSHPITRAMAATPHATVHLVLPRSISSSAKNVGAPEAAKVETLLQTTQYGSIHEFARFRGNESAPRIPEVRTNVSLAVAVERGGLAGLAADRGASRLVVTGDAIFLNNKMIDSAANSSFAVYAVNWLLDRAVLLADVGPRPYKEFRLTVSDSDKPVLLWLFLAAFPGGALVLGFFVWLRRRS